MAAEQIYPLITRCSSEALVSLLQELFSVGVGDITAEVVAVSQSVSHAEFR